MLRRKNCLFGFMLLLSVFFLALSGCGGGSGSGGDDNGDDSNNGGCFFKATAEDYLGNWNWEDKSKCQYAVEFTVGNEIGKWERGSYHLGSMNCEILEATVNLTGDINAYGGYIQLLIEPYEHGISVRAFRDITTTHNATVELSGQLTGPEVISVYELMMWEIDGDDEDDYFYRYDSSEHDDKPLLFTKQ